MCCGEHLIDEGALSVRAYCTHGILSGDALQTISESALEKLYISDTVLSTLDHPKIEFVTCADLLASAIRQLVSNRSLSEIG